MQIRLFDHPLPVYTLFGYMAYLRGVAQPHAGYGDLDDLRDFWWASCRMTRLQYGAKI